MYWLSVFFSVPWYLENTFYWRVFLWCSSSWLPPTGCIMANQTPLSGPHSTALHPLASNRFHLLTALWNSGNFKQSVANLWLNQQLLIWRLKLWFDIFKMRFGVSLDNVGWRWIIWWQDKRDLSTFQSSSRVGRKLSKLSPIKETYELTLSMTWI